MQILEKISDGLGSALLLIAGLAILAMMGVTTADVILRYFRHPIPGAYEIVGQIGGIAVAFAMAHTTAVKGHVAVSIIIRRFSKRTQNIIDGFTSLLGALLFALAAWRLFVMGYDYQVNNHLSATIRMPLFPVVYSVAVAMAATCLALVTATAKHVLRVFRHDA